jgi:outer membrane protein assembly factor BamB
MLQRWLKTLVVFTFSASLLVSCKQKKDYSKDEPLEPSYSPSVFIGSQNQYVYALNPETGEKKWEYNLKTDIVAVPVVFNKKYLVAAKPDSLVVLDVNSGKVIKNISIPGLNLEASFIQESGQYLIGSYISDVPSGAGNYFRTDLEKLIQIGYLDPAFTKLYSSTVTSSTPTIYNGMIYIAGKGEVRAYNLLTPFTGGWVSPLPSAGTIASSPVVSFPYVYVGGRDGNLYALNISDGTVGWTFSTGGQILSSPIVYGGNIIFGSNDYNLYCLDSAAKAPRWVVTTGNSVVSSPFAYNQVVYFASQDYSLYAVDIIDGAVKWQFPTKDLVNSSPVAHGNTVYISSFDKNLYAFDTTGVLKWSRNIDGVIRTSPVLYDLNNVYYPAISGMSEN